MYKVTWNDQYHGTVSVAAASLPKSAMTEYMSYSGVVLDMSAPQAGCNLAPL